MPKDWFDDAPETAQASAEGAASDSDGEAVVAGVSGSPKMQAETPPSTSFLPKLKCNWIVQYPGGVNVRVSPTSLSELTGEHLDAGKIVEGFVDLTDEGDDCYMQLADSGRGWVPVQKGTINVMRTHIPDEEVVALRGVGRRGSALGSLRGEVPVSSPSPSRKSSIIDDLRRASVAASAGNMTGRRGSSVGQRGGSSLGNIGPRKSSVASGRLAGAGMGKMNSGYIDITAGSSIQAGSAVVGVTDEDLQFIAHELRNQMLELTAKQDAETRARLLRIEQDEERIKAQREKERDVELQHIERRSAAAIKAMEDTHQQSLAKLGETERILKESVGGLEGQLRNAADVAEVRVHAAAEARLRVATSVLEKEIAQSREREELALQHLRDSREREESEHRARLEAEELVRINEGRKRGELLAHKFPSLSLGLEFYEPKDQSGAAIAVSGSGPFEVVSIDPEGTASLFDIVVGDAVVGILEQPLLGAGLRGALTDPATFPATLLFRRDTRCARRLAMLVHLERRAEERRATKTLEHAAALQHAEEMARLEREALEAAKMRHALNAFFRKADKQRRAEDRQGLWAEDCLNYRFAATSAVVWREQRERRLMHVVDPICLALPERLRLADLALFAAEDRRSTVCRAERTQRLRKRRQRDADRRIALAEDCSRNSSLFQARGLTSGCGFSGHAFAMLASHALGQLSEKVLELGLFLEAKAILRRAVDVVDVSSPIPAPFADLAVVFSAPPLGLEFQRGIAPPGASSSAALDSVPPLVARVVPGGRAALCGITAGCQVVAVEGNCGAVAESVASLDHLMRLLLGCTYPVTVVFRPPGGEQTLVFDAPPLGLALRECGGGGLLPRVHHVVSGGRAALLGVKDGWELTALGAQGAPLQPVYTYQHALEVLSSAVFPLTAVFRGAFDDAAESDAGQRGWGNGWMADLYDGDDDDLAEGSAAAQGWDEEKLVALMSPMWDSWVAEVTVTDSEREATLPKGSSARARREMWPRLVTAKLLQGLSVQQATVGVAEAPATLLAIALDSWAYLCGERKLWTAQADTFLRRLALLEKGVFLEPEPSFGALTAQTDRGKTSTRLDSNSLPFPTHQDMEDRAEEVVTKAQAQTERQARRERKAQQALSDRTAVLETAAAAADSTPQPEPELEPELEPEPKHKLPGGIGCPSAPCQPGPGFGRYAAL